MTAVVRETIINAAIWTLIVALICAIAGTLLVGLDYMRRKRKFWLGAVTGLTIGASAALITMGLITIAAGNVYGYATLILIGIGSTGAGVALLWLLRIFRPVTDQPIQIRMPNLLRRTASMRQVPRSASRSPLKIFISYRRDDSSDVTGRIYDRLVNTYGKESVYKDVDSIPFGVDFRKHLKTMIDQCDVMLVVIGNYWLTIAETGGQRRLENPADFVRIEIEVGLQRDIPIVPLLVRGASMPAEAELPPDLKEFAYRNGTQVRYDPDFHSDMDRLIKSLESYRTHT